MNSTLEFTPTKTERPLWGLHLQAKGKDEKQMGKPIRKNSKIKGAYYLNLDNRTKERIPKAKNSFKCSCVSKEPVNKDIFLTFRNGERKTMQPIRIKTESLTRIRTISASSDEHLSNT